MLAALTLASVLVTAEADCKDGCTERGNQCRVLCTQNPLHDLCFNICKNDEADCKGDCAMGVVEKKTRVRGSSLQSLENACAAGNGKACISAGMAWFVGGEGPKDEGKAAQLFGAGCARREADACAAAGDLMLQGKGIDKNRVAALDSLEKSCQWGSSLGCHLLARAIDTGAAGQRDPGRVKKLYVEACAAEFAPACLALGDFLVQKGIYEDPGKAATSVERACDLGSAVACERLCAMSRRPDGPPHDPLQTLNYCTRACSAQVMGGCTAQALLLLKGPPFKFNPKRARELLDAACDGTDPTACVVLGDGVERGAFGWKKSAAEASTAFERAALIVEGTCRKGDASACSLQALLGVEDRGGLKPAADARTRLAPLCGPNDALGCASLGRALMLEACGKVEPAQALATWQLGCQSKQATSCRRLAQLLLDGAEGVPKDPASAQALFDGACEEDDADACQQLGKLLLSGEGGTKDPKRAKAAKKKACKLGLKEACR